jgi:hypothetical protein
MVNATTLITLTCYYSSWGSYIFGWAQFFPVFASIALFAISATSQDIFFLFLGLYLDFAWSILYILQVAYGTLVSDPFCPLYYAYSVPSTVIFYSVSLFAFVFIWAWSSGFQTKIGLLSWGWILAIAIVPLFSLIYYRVNTPFDVLISSGAAIVPTIAYVALLRLMVAPSIELILLGYPWCLFGYESRYLVGTPQTRDAAARIRLLKSGKAPPNFLQP